jgi:hypothetical protein
MYDLIVHQSQYIPPCYKGRKFIWDVVEVGVNVWEEDNYEEDCGDQKTCKAWVLYGRRVIEHLNFF